MSLSSARIKNIAEGIAQQETTQFHTNIYLKCDSQGRGILLNSRNIIDLKIKESVLVGIPKMTLTFNDSLMFTDMYPLEDGDLIRVEIAKVKTHDSIISSLTFRLQDFNIVNDTGTLMHSFVVTLTALADHNIFWPIKTQAYSDSTSTEVLTKIGNSLTTANMDKRVSSNDKMTWLQSNENTYSFIKKVLKYSYITDGDVLYSYFNRDNEFVITSLLNQTREAKTDIDNNKSVLMAIFDSRKSLDDSQDREDEMVNPTGSANPYIYFRNAYYRNMAGTVNRTGNYGSNLVWYGLDGEYSDELIKADIPLMTELTLKRKELVGNKTANTEFGYKFAKDNMHNNGHRALILNKYLTDNAFSAPLVITSNATNKIQLFDLLYVKFPINNKYGQDEMKMDKYNDQQSGYYFVGSIIHQLSSVGNGFYNMTLVLYRNGINKNSAMDNSEWSLNSKV